MARVDPETKKKDYADFKRGYRELDDGHRRYVERVTGEKWWSSQDTFTRGRDKSEVKEIADQLSNPEDSNWLESKLKEYKNKLKDYTNDFKEASIEYQKAPFKTVGKYKDASSALEDATIGLQAKMFNDVSKYIRNMSQEDQDTMWEYLYARLGLYL